MSEARRGRPLTLGDVQKFETAHALEMLSPFERAFLEDFKDRFSIYGLKTNIFPKQYRILNELYERHARKMSRD